MPKLDYICLLHLPGLNSTKTPSLAPFLTNITYYLAWRVRVLMKYSALCSVMRSRCAGRALNKTNNGARRCVRVRDTAVGF